ncbi:MAG: hypothetical protein CL711_03155 [Chloroflexi bacterium]|nr:hypothetical protein [Chloroflexota bacterium]
MLTDKLLGTTETTWSKTNSVGAVLLTRARCALEVGLEVEERLLTDCIDGNRPGLVAGATGIHETKDDDGSHQHKHV